MADQSIGCHCAMTNDFLPQLVNQNIYKVAKIYEYEFGFGEPTEAEIRTKPKQKFRPITNDNR